ncbi:hypothetical protein AB0953_16670 [Streptomyces sp. NPDC046866]|uniref:hypothetical protein n=1 Tax=Streptomyces sp. NPDC046866 TaxID=3154921 RepID=UPI003455A677
MPELTEPQRAARRKRARDVIETALADTLTCWDGATPPTPADLADAALDGMGDLAAEILTDGTMMRSLEIRDGVATLSLEPATEILKVFVASMRGVLDGYGAENYVETEMTAPSISLDLRDGANPVDAYTVTIQRRTRPTPHEFRRRAEQQLADVLRIVASWYEDVNDGHGLDASDLVNELDRAGYPLPDDKADQ